MKAYWVRIKENLINFWQPGDEIICSNYFKKEKQTCQLCGYTPITHNHVLENLRSREKLIVGSKCVHNFKIVLEKIGHDIKIFFPKELEKIANLINQKYPNTVEIVDIQYNKIVDFDDEDDLYESFFEERYYMSGDDLAPEGMGSDEFDWDSFDFEPKDD